MLRAVVGSLLTIAVALFIASFVSVYEVVARDGDGPGWRYVPVAQVIGWTGIAASVLWAAWLMVTKARSRRPIAWTPLIAVPLIVESWVGGFLIAVVLSSM
ncbi:hypothetical protein DFR70_104588 [Nocardia tenerifensis]|uniref:Uncharacterized protein n=1 Tax=Nocardia tenerifensis TaxID=228006 RepID=A0A318KG26_9NOCA|nr:hypothetical protein DFR70_104588 [Nocardia tenerifensis]